VIGVIIALGAVWLSSVTHNPMWDALGSIAIGVLLAVMAVFLIRKNRSMLLGKSVSPADRAKLQTLLADDPAVDSVAAHAAVVRGTDSYRVAAELDFNGAYLAEKYLETHDAAEICARLETPEDVSEFLKEFGEDVVTQVGVEVDRIEAKIRENIPKVKRIGLEPD